MATATIARCARSDRQVRGGTRLRVGIDATAVYDEGTGVENHVLTVVDALARFSDHELVCFVRRRPPEAWRALEDRIEIHTFPTDSQVVATQVLLPRAARRAGLDLLFCGGKPPPLAYRGSQLVVIHDAIPWEHPEYMGSRRAVLWFRTLYRLAVRPGTVLATVSESSKRALAEALGVPATNLAVVGNALAPWFEEAAARSDLPRPAAAPDGDYLLSVSRLDPRRGGETLLDAWGSLHAERPGLRLVLAGKVGWNVDGVVERARRTAGVIMTGEVDRPTLAGLYRHASALVSASMTEGFGLPVLEAMAFGAPVVATSIPPHVELAAGVAEFFAPGQAAELAAALRRVLDDPQVRERARRAGVERAADFSAEQLAAKWSRAAAGLSRAAKR